MSSIQVTNVNFESTGNNQIRYVSANTIQITAGGANVIVANATATVAGIATINATTISVSSNLVINTSTISIGNTTVNTIIGAATSNQPTFALTDGANIAINCTSYANFSIALGGTRNFDNPTGLVAGQGGIIWITTNTFSSCTWGSFWKFTANTAPTLTAAAGSQDMVLYWVANSTNIKATTLLNVG